MRGLGRKSVLEIKHKLAQVKILSDPTVKVYSDTVPDQSYLHFSQKDSIVQLNLTNRSFNALTRAGMRTIGEVLQRIESGGLVTMRGLGRKSVLEIKHKLAQVKILSDPTVKVYSDTVPDQSYLHFSQKDSNEHGNFDGVQRSTPPYVSQGDPIELLNLSLNSFSALTLADVRTVGEVVQLAKSGKMLTIPTLGRKSFLEITAKLAQVHDFDASENESPTIRDEVLRRVVRRQSHLVNKQLQGGLLHEDAIIAERSIKDWLAGIEKIENNRVYEVLTSILGSSLNICEEIEFFLNQIPGQYRMAILLSTYGLERKNLRQAGDELGISRERVRQIRGEIKEKITSMSDLKARPAFLKMQSVLLIAGDSGLDITYKGWTQRIRSLGIVGDWTSKDFVGTDAVEVLIAMYNLLRDCSIRWLQMPENLQYAVQLAASGTPDVSAKIRHARETLAEEIKRLIHRHTKFSGGVHARWLSQEMQIELDEVADILRGLGFRVLSKGWFVPNPSQISYRDVFHRGLRKMFQYCGRLSIDDICAGIRHQASRSGFSVPEYLADKGAIQSRSVFPVPPPDVMTEILQIHGYPCEDELYDWDGTYDGKRNEGEIVIMNYLEQIGPVLHHAELTQAFIESDLSFPTLHATMNYSPLFDKIERGLYKLRGRKVSYEDIERAQAAGEPQSLRPEVEYDMDGNIIVSITLSAIAVGLGTISCQRFPNLSGEDWECYVHGEVVGELNAVENEFRHLKKAFELLNCQQGERLKFIFNTCERRVAIEKERENAKE